MARNEDVYTITDKDILASIGEEMKPKGGRDIRPDRRPSRSMTGGGAGDARALAASTLSLFLCGAGQIYNKQGKLGLLMLLTQAFVASVNWAVVQVWPSLVELSDIFGVNEWRLMLGVAMVDFLTILLMITSVSQAYRYADLEAGGFQGAGNPIFSGLASMLIPGWGQLVNAQPGKAITFFFSALTGVYVVVLMRLTPFLRLFESSVDASQFMLPRLTMAAAGIVGVAAAMWILNVYDAILVAGFHRRMS